MIYDFLSVDRALDKPLCDQLYDNVRSAMAKSLLRRGDKLPSVRRLSQDISVSRTTVESAYGQLCAEGYIINRAKSGFYVEAESAEPSERSAVSIPQRKPEAPVRYDFSGLRVDPDCIDIKFWQRCIKDVLSSPYLIASYGEPRGEEELRSALCNYSRRVRGVDASPERIIIGAGTQALLSVLLGLLGDYGCDAAIEKGFFPQGEQILSDFRYNITPLIADKNGIILDDSVKSRVIFVNASGSIRGSSPIPVNQRARIIRYTEKHDAVIIEDDYNGELRYTSKPVPALQGMSPERVVYIGSFSKLLLPSVRISYMVLPAKLAERYAERESNYNQTSSKAEQLALARYISCGRLDRQLRKLRKLYAEKSSLMYSCVREAFPDAKTDIIETSLSVRIKLQTDADIGSIKSMAQRNGIRLGKCREKNGLKYFYLSFAGIPDEKIPEAVSALREIL